MDSHTVRETFVRFYTERAHTLVEPAPLVPRDDPTLLFNSAGMVQFKRLYATSEPLPYTRAVSVQPCLRAGGKDSDLENVGTTARHLSFFQMLGNFSFGDYFKKEAIDWGWELLTKEYGLDPDRLWVSVYEDDDEAEALWLARGFPKERLVRLGAKDNFWGPAGKTGACGPCSEIHWDRGPSFEGKAPGPDDVDRFLEIYNLVFPQFDQQDDGSRPPLRNRGIDTGMGLERLAMVIQGADTLFDTDQFRPVMDRTQEMSGASYADGDHDVKRAIRIVADHVRGVTFALAEGVLPSNEGRGYVIRRILRRAVRRGWALGIEGSFLHELSGLIVDQYARWYPLLTDARERVALAIRHEEEHFAATLKSGMGRFEDAVKKATKEGRSTLSGETVFTLYDTYGFPADLVEEMARERGLEVDLAGFEAAMGEQKARSRQSSRFDTAGDAAITWTPVTEGPSSEFLGYDELEATVTVRRYAAVGDGFVVVLDRTPFYAESGGQVGDTGILRFAGGEARVVDTRKQEGEIVHHVDGDGVDPARVFAGEGTARVDATRRADVQRNHTATHLLHAALRNHLGTHVAQAGSFVGPDRLRFDFSHMASMTPEEIRAVEDEVSRGILADHAVSTTTTSLADALEAGAMALFGEKYGDSVRQVVVPGVSRELCGGTHVRATGEIGPFVIVAESAVAAGTRRVEALTGPAALRHIREERDLVSRIAGRLQSGRHQVGEKVDALLDERTRLETEIKKLRDAERRAALGGGGGGDNGPAREEVDGVAVLVQRVPASNVGEMRQAADLVRGKLQSGVAILGADVGGKASFLVFVTPDLVEAKRFRADELVREVAGIAGGSGGGKPDLALAGAKDVDKIDAALEHGRSVVLGALRGT